MPRFPVSGSTGQAPTTVYFGAVPDKYNMLSKGYSFSGTPTMVGWGSANLLNGWTPYNQAQDGGSNAITSSLGGSTSAPDGTTNGQKLVESATTSVHMARAVIPTLQNFGNWHLTVSVFAKAAERTRFALYVGNGVFDPAFFPGSSGGCKTVFDLAGGRIAVVGTAFNTVGGVPYTPINDEIVSFGNGWYRCSMTIALGAGANRNYCLAIKLDNGSGTSAESSSYAGDGSSGVYFWRSTALPPKAWGINTVTLFDDFTSLSTIDVNNTKAPGFKWYVNNEWPNFFNEGSPATSVASFSIVGGTQLNFNGPASNSPIGGRFMMSTVSLGGANYTGFTYKTPVLLEASMGFDAILNNTQNAPSPFWSHNLEILLSTWNQTVNGISQDYTNEFDWNELDTAVGFPSCFLSARPASNILGITDSFGPIQGYTKWASTYAYNSMQWIVDFNGSLYQSTTNSPNLNNQPDISPSWWTPFTPGSNFPAGHPVWDMTQLNLWTALWLPYTPNGEAGHVIGFFNGNYIWGATQSFPNTAVPAHAIYAPILFNQPGNVTGPDSFYVADWTLQSVIAGGALNANTYYDYIRVTQ